MNVFEILQVAVVILFKWDIGILYVKNVKDLRGYWRTKVRVELTPIGYSYSR